jgi:hypothetical protein
MTEPLRDRFRGVKQTFLRRDKARRIAANISFA